MLKCRRSYEFQCWLDGISQTKHTWIVAILKDIRGKQGVIISDGGADKALVIEVVLIEKSNIMIQGGAYPKAMFIKA